MSNIAVIPEWNEERVSLLRGSYAKDLSDAQFDVFMELCKAQGLNPFTKDVYGMVVSGRLVVITSIGGLTKIAERTGRYAGMDDVEIVYGENGKPEKATATVYKMLEGQRCPFTATVIFKEYSTGKNNWSKMPVTMISKVARAHALRIGFPEANNVYEESEVETMNRDFRGSGRASEWTNFLKEADKPKAPDYIEIEGISDKDKTEGKENERSK